MSENISGWLSVICCSSGGRGELWGCSAASGHPEKHWSWQFLVHEQAAGWNTGLLTHTHLNKHEKIIMFPFTDFDFISGQLHLCSAWHPEQSESFRGAGQQDRWSVAQGFMCHIRFSDFLCLASTCALLIPLYLRLVCYELYVLNVIQGCVAHATVLTSVCVLVCVLSPEDIHNHFKKYEVEYLQFAFRWMNNLLMRELPLRCTIRLWDTYQVQHC